ncbi:hypothetical protein [Alteribacter natronophilus]|uniref:hypothetical protein n=1 Tax=Alteribacter natronophilus TaxID=2583810 RepID=UPI00110ED4F9|nr:hypothetical protein [Alteribacter natronophilus]TMW71758.1 hypothetical protein FGB90_12080 [Alteribacter natronophilus]
MAKKKTSFVVDFNEMKKKKQVKTEEALNEVYSLFFSFIDRKANLREKVRAKKLFAHKVNWPADQEFDSWVQLHFEHWFAFDYVTVIGSRMFDLFVREYKEKLSIPMLELCGHLMLMSLEPVLIEKWEAEDGITVKRLATGRRTVVHPFLSPFPAEEGDLVFMRILPAGFQEFAAGPFFTVSREDRDRIMTQLEAVSNTGEKGHSPGVTRYMKEYGIDYLRYAVRTQ